MRGAVMTCPAREALWEQCRQWWPGWPLVIDDGCGVPENWCRTLERAEKECANEQEWVVLAQDDAEPAAGLTRDLGRLLGEAPLDAGIVSSFSLGWKRDPANVAAGVRWRKRRRGELLFVLMLAVRCRLVPAVAAGVRAGSGPHDDARLRRWLDMHPEVVAYTHLPSLVQHRGKQSVMGKGWKIGGRPRVSPTYLEGKTIAEVCGW